jgi:ankyrin repeat protein
MRRLRLPLSSALCVKNMPKIIVKVLVIFFSYLPCFAAYYFISNTGNTYFTPLERAAIGGSSYTDRMQATRLAKEYLDSGANPNSLGLVGGGGTPLHAAASNNNVELIGYLLKHGALINRKGCKDGKTALMVAAESERKEAVSVLLQLGADKSLKDKDGNEALKLSKDMSIRNILTYGYE